MSRKFGLVAVVALLIVLLVAFNVIAGSLLRGARLDVTQGAQYTLTSGSRNIARSPVEPVSLTFYYSAKLARGQASLEAYAQRVRELLEEFARVSGGKVQLAIVDPVPFSETEDKAVESGLQGLPLGPEGNLYFGLVGTNTVDSRETIAFFDPKKERLLEYDVAKLVASLANPKKKQLGLIASLQVMGGYTMDPRTRQPRPLRIYAAFEEIKKLYEIKNLGAQVDTVPDDIDLLVVVHPKALPEPTQFAIDQFVLRGGRLIAFVDPVCENDEQGNEFDFSGRNSSLARLLGAWGVEVPEGQLAADQDIALRVRTNPRDNESMPFVLWLSAKETELNRDDPVTGQAHVVNFASSGFIRAKKPDGGDDTLKATITPLITTSPRASTLDSATLPFPPDPGKLFKEFLPGTEKLTLVARLSGKVRTAFPDGPPALPDGQPAKIEGEQLKESKDSINVILFADADVAADSLWVQRGQLLPGLETLQKLADNGDLVMACVDNMNGSNDLIQVRARQETARPFTKVEEIRKSAEQQYRKEEMQLEARAQQAQDRIAELQRQRGGDNAGGLILTAEQQAELDKLRLEMVSTRKDLRAVRLKLNERIESLGDLLRFINIGLVPLALAVVAVIIAFLRAKHRRSAAVARAATG